MSLVLQSSGGGSVTLAEPTTASNFTQDLPAVTGNVLIDSATQTLTNKSIAATQLTGTIAAARLPAGSVLQVVSNTTTTYTSIASTSLTDVTNLTASITPTSATSKILVLISANYNIRRSTNDFISGNFGIFRGARQIWTGERTTILKAGTSVGGDVISGSQATLITLDNPSTTSSTTYKLQACVNTTANTGNINFNDFASSTSSSSITLMEIAA